MSAQDLAIKYIAAMENTLESVKRLSVTVSEESLDDVFNYVKAYLKDAKYFLKQGKFETSLVSIAYSEGLLDALKLVGAVSVSPADKTSIV